MKRRRLGWFGEMMAVLPWVWLVFQVPGAVIAWGINKIWLVQCFEEVSIAFSFIGFVYWLYLLFTEWRFNRDVAAAVRARAKQSYRSVEFQPRKD